ncbi:stalk domain-containing protein [Paenibacillus agilis]|nr:stalk domain-containing protein [Paenibacillus agilis]
MKKWIASFSIASMLAVAAIPAYAAPAAVKSNMANFESNSIVKKDGSLWVWGRQQSAPTQVHSISDVAYTVDNTFIVKKDHSVYYFQKNQMNTREQEITPIEGLYGVKDVISVYPGYILLDEKGQVYSLNPDSEDLEKSLSDLLIPVEGLNGVKSLSSYSYTIEDKGYETYWLALKQDGTVWQSNVKDSTSIQQIKGLTDIADISSNLALQKDGTLWALPEEDSVGKLAVPFRVKGVNNIKKVYSDGYSQMAIDSQSRLWFLSGTVTGYSDSTDYLTHLSPVRLTTIAQVEEALVVDRELVARTKNGDVYRTSTQHEKMPSNPKFELVAKDIVEIEDGYKHMIMQKADGTLWAWGLNSYADYGSGDYKYDNEYSNIVPVQKPIVVELNGKSVPLTNGVIVRNDQAFIPLRSVFGSMGAEIKWDAEDKQALVTQKQASGTTTVISINFSTGETKVNDKPVKLQTAPFISGDTAFLPLRFVSETLGAKVSWSKQDDKISITMQ